MVHKLGFSNGVAGVYTSTFMLASIFSMMETKLLIEGGTHLEL